MDFSPLYFQLLQGTNKEPQTTRGPHSSFRSQIIRPYPSTLHWDPYSRFPNQNCWWQWAQEATITVPQKPLCYRTVPRTKLRFERCTLNTNISSVNSDPSHPWRPAHVYRQGHYKKLCLFLMLMCSKNNSSFLLRKWSVCSKSLFVITANQSNSSCRSQELLIHSMYLTLYLCLSLTKASVTLHLLSAHWGLELDFIVINIISTAPIIPQVNSFLWTQTVPEIE